METQIELEKEIGTKEPEILQPKKVKIVKLELKEVNKMKKLVCGVKHPDRDEPIDISRVEQIGKDKKVKAVGLWYKEDEDNNIQKGIALSQFLVFNGANKISDLMNKEVETAIEDTGYLCFKAH